MALRRRRRFPDETDYSDHNLFPGMAPNVPVPFVRPRDFSFASVQSVMAPSSNLLALIDIERQFISPTGPLARSDGGLLDETSLAMVEFELLNCVTAKPIFDAEPAGPFLRMALLWGRFSEITPDKDQRERADAREADAFNAAWQELFAESHHSRNGPERQAYHYRWTATLILEHFAEAAAGRDVARAAWVMAAAAHQKIAEHARHRNLRRAHKHMARIDKARSKG